MTNHNRARLVVVFSMVAVTLVAGCKLFGRDKLIGPVSYSRQASEIQKIVRIGDLRQDVVKELERAGIEGEYTRHGNSVYYCQIWNRDDGEKWQMSVSLQFVDGALSAIALYDSPWGGRLRADDLPARTTGFPRTGPPESDRNPVRTDQPFPWSPSQREPTAHSQPLDPRTGLRTPFGSR